MNKSDIMKIIGNNLKKYRNMMKLTQEELAERVGISTSFCANIERGSKGVSMIVLCDLADALGITVNHLVYEENAGIGLKNIEFLLKDKPEALIMFIESIIHTCIESFPSTHKV